MFSVRNLFESLNRSNIDYIDFYDNEFEHITTIAAGNINSESYFYHYNVLTIEFECVLSTRLIITLDVKREDLKGW